MDRLLQAELPRIAELHGIGMTTAAALHTFLAEPRNRVLIEKLKAAGVRMDEPVERAEHSMLAGRTFVITGTHTRSRKEITTLIERHGGRVAGSVSRSTDYLVAGESPGSKLDRARELDVKVIDEHELFSMIESAAD
jgi:DNA ligase (NAD+)